MGRTTRAIAIVLLVASIVACGESNSRERNVSVLAGTSCKKAGQSVSPNGIRHVCGKTPIGNVWYVTSRSKGNAVMCRTLGKIRFKSKVVWVCGSSKGSGQWFATKPLPITASGVSLTAEPVRTTPPSSLGASDAFTPSTVAPSTTSATTSAQTTPLPAGGYTTAQDAPEEPNTQSLAGPNDDPLPEPRSADLTGPTIDAVDVSPKEVTPGDRFTVTISASDPAGVTSVTMMFMFGRAQRDFCGQSLSLIKGDAFSGVWQVECTAPQVGSNGEYVVVPSAQDRVNNYTNVNCCTLSPLRGSFTLSGAREDSVGPEFSNLQLSTKKVGPGDTFTISTSASDDTGVKSVQFSFKLGVQQIDFCGGSMNRVSGSSRNGSWTATCKVPTLVRNGTYVVKLYAADLANNYTNVNCCTTSDVSESFVVASGTDDDAGPTISSMSIDKTIARPGDTVRIIVVMADATGIKWNGITSSINGAQRDICGQSLQKASGTQTASTWYSNCQIPITAQPGQYEFRAYATDLVGNSTNVNCCDRSSIRAYLDVE